MANSEHEIIADFARADRDDGCAKVESVCTHCGDKFSAYTEELLVAKQRRHKCRNVAADAESTGA